MTSPLIISLDIETYGAFEFFENKGAACPDQTVFHPELSKKVDLGTCLPCRLVPQCAITIVHGEPSDPTGWEPGDTAVIDMCGQDISVVEDMLRKADTILGSNIVFDIMYLRQFKSIAAIFRQFPRPTLVDTVILSWIHSGVRKERSLKALGPALGAFTYERTLKSGKFKFPMCADAIKYNAEDTHNAVLAARTLCQRIADERGRKITPTAIGFHSDRLWNIENLSTNGQAFISDELIQFRDDVIEIREQHEDALARKEIILSGEGSGTTQSKLIDDAVTEANRIFYNLHDTTLLEYSDKKRSVRNNKDNRNVLSAIIKHDHPYSPIHESLQSINACSVYESMEHECNKILADTISRGQGITVNSGCITSGNLRICYPSWYGAPTEDGGVQSARLSCRRPAAQTWTRDMRRFMVAPGRMLYHMDMTAFELRIAAAISRDYRMSKFAFQPDPYSALGQNRTAAKTALLVGVNGGSASKAWRTSIATNAELITLNEVQSLPIFTEWTDYRNTRDMWLADGQNGTLRLREADIVYNHNANKTIHDSTSFMVQGHAAVFMSMLQSCMLHESDISYEFSLQLHDELVFAVPTSTDEGRIRRDIDRHIHEVTANLFECKGIFTYKLEASYNSGE
jgi:hypothetical protein